MKSFFPKDLIEAARLNCLICLAVSDREINGIEEYLVSAEKLRASGLTELSKQFDDIGNK